MSNTNKPAIDAFRERSAKIKDRARGTGVYKVVEAEQSGDLDTTLTLRINSILKAHFESLCKSEHTTVSREVKRFITEAVRTQSLL